MSTADEGKITDAVDMLIAWLRKRGADSSISYLTLYGSAAAFVAKHFHGQGARDLADALAASRVHPAGEAVAWVVVDQNGVVMVPDEHAHAVRGLFDGPPVVVNGKAMKKAAKLYLEPPSSSARAEYEAGQMIAIGTEIEIREAREAAIRDCLDAARKVGNYGDYRREELTADFGQPRFDLYHEIIAAIEALTPRAPL